MPTKKQKRAAALARHEARMAELKRSGLAAQKRDREARQRELLVTQEKAHEKHSRFEDWCLHCQTIKKALAQGVPLKEAQQLSKQLVNRRTDEIDAPRLIQNAEFLYASLDPNGMGTIELVDNSSVEMECV